MLEQACIREKGACCRSLFVHGQDPDAQLILLVSCCWGLSQRTARIDELPRRLPSMTKLFRGVWRVSGCMQGALPGLVAILNRFVPYPGPPSTGASTVRRAADAITNLAHENISIKSRVRTEGGIPPLVALLGSYDAKVFSFFIMF